MDCLSHMWGVREGLLSLGSGERKAVAAQIHWSTYFPGEQEETENPNKNKHSAKGHQPPHVLNQETGICSSNLFNLNSLINPFI